MKISDKIYHETSPECQQNIPKFKRTSKNKQPKYYLEKTKTLLSKTDGNSLRVCAYSFLCILSFTSIGDRTWVLSPEFKIDQPKFIYSFIQGAHGRN